MDLLQVADQRAALREEGTEEETAPWMSGDVTEEGQDKSASVEDLNAETEHLLRTQREYYDSVHVIREKVCCCIHILPLDTSIFLYFR